MCKCVCVCVGGGGEGLSYLSGKWNIPEPANIRLLLTSWSGWVSICARPGGSARPTRTSSCVRPTRASCWCLSPSVMTCWRRWRGSAHCDASPPSAGGKRHVSVEYMNEP